MSTAIAILCKDMILNELRAGRMLGEIAPGLGVSAQAISQALIEDPEYREALKAQAAAMIWETKTMTWNAREAIDIARARECAKFAWRYAEATDPEKWAPKQTINSNVNAQVNVVTSERPRMSQEEWLKAHAIDGEATRVIDK